MTKEVGRCYRQIFWNEEVGGLWKMIRRKRNLDVRKVAVQMALLCGSEGNRRPGIALAMRLGLCGICIHLRVQWPKEGR